MPRHCLICSSDGKASKTAELISQGLSDQAVANALNALSPEQPPMSLTAVSRHRRAHILKVAQDRLNIVSKGSQARWEREQLAITAKSDPPTPRPFVDAFFGLRAQGEKLQRIEDRLDSMASMAEESRSPTGWHRCRPAAQECGGGCQNGRHRRLRGAAGARAGRRPDARD